MLSSVVTASPARRVAGVPRVGLGRRLGRARELVRKRTASQCAPCVRQTQDASCVGQMTFHSRLPWASPLWSGRAREVPPGKRTPAEVPPSPVEPPLASPVSHWILLVEDDVEVTRSDIASVHQEQREAVELVRVLVVVADIRRVDVERLVTFQDRGPPAEQ